MLSVPAPIPNNLGQTDITVSVDTEPLEIAFDANGNLWTEAFQSLPCSNQPGCGASAGTTSELIDFPAATLHTTGAARIWTSGGFFNPGGSTVLTNSASYGGVAFDTTGNLYDVTAVSSSYSFGLQIYGSSAFGTATPQPSQSLAFPAGYITTGPTYR